MIPFFYKLLMEQTPDGQAALRTTLLAGLATASRMMTAVSPSGLFLGGDCMSLADVALAPWWQRTLTGMSLTLMLLCTRSIRAAPVCTMRATKLYGYSTNRCALLGIQQRPFLVHLCTAPLPSCLG